MANLFAKGTLCPLLQPFNALEHPLVGVLPRPEPPVCLSLLPDLLRFPPRAGSHGSPGRSRDTERTSKAS
eukprot:3440362-Prorocentrum_lima.AAC.1